MNRLPRRQLIPDGWTHHEDLVRFHHDDLPDLTDQELRAEHTLLTVARDERIFHREHPRLIAGAVTTDFEWIEERLRRIKTEGQRRQRRAA